MLLYIHFPFCLQKCTYCAFCSQTYSKQLVDKYLGLLLQEMSYWGQCLGYPRLSSLYFGGGTPSLLSKSALERILDAITAYFVWSPEIEFSLEANPETISCRNDLIRLMDLGVNRLSLGVQSLDNAKLNILGRAHSAEKAISVCQEAQEAGFNNINLDMLWGLPGQDCEDWLKDLAFLYQLEVPHFSCYGLTLEPETCLARWVQEGKLGLPDEEEQRKMFLYCSDFLTQRGYCHYEISNFAKDGFECFHNKGYWNGCDYLGLGPSAVSTLSGRRWQNPCDLREYEQRVHGGNLWEQGQRLTLQERDREQVMLKMRTYHGISLEEYAYLTLRHMDRSCVPCLETFLQEDLMHCDNGFLRLTPRGMLVSNEILARMLF